jgi:hypothetical protein
MPMSCVIPLQHPKKKEGFTMTPQFPRRAQQAGRWLAPLLSLIFGAVSLIAAVDPESLAGAAECQVIEEGGKIQEMPAWRGTTASTLSYTITAERDIYAGLVPASMLSVAPMNNSRYPWGNRENQEIATIGVCMSQDIRKSALFNQTMSTSIGKTQAKVSTKTMKVFALPYNGKRQIHTMRTTLPELGISTHDKVPTIIGPVQEIRKSNLSDERSVSQIVATLPSTVESFSLLGGQPFVAVNQIQDALPLADNESLRMNRTTTQVLHGGNCASGCP